MHLPGANLPDPTADLHWSDYRGAIHDIFAANAKRHPDRLCVVETQSSRTARREFTYKQINETSNILAHHLLQNGIERGDLVMIYAHRGVDLVVAVFGVLKAGATFSVIDPTYPPDRQEMYLDVAKPRALIVIAKASQEAGELSGQVRSYISENLHLKTEIPTLMLHDDGNLTGGQAKGSVDVFQPQYHLGNTSPGVVIGPDDTPTLSFTSGSEGRPKGVKGRHFSLTYYFPWMAETFGLTENDKFTMLSGIAHDPIQRDIFTPLFLGAQILVPSRGDIQHEKLAEWMKREGATVTHLTPAMGQTLVGGATTVFPSLHHAFFVGDILIKRDCRALQGLAPNANIVNMFGTTETQRAVSYFQIPSIIQDAHFLDKMSGAIPAGRGMHDVQLLVVNQKDRTKQCEIGETGEIYVRAGGLAEGYLGEELAELTRTKFVENWFIEPRKWIEEDKKRVAQLKARQPWREYYKGPRDRLYRSGDLGHYTQSGDVECTGRADNEVKASFLSQPLLNFTALTIDQIRGFRINLGEIDHWVSEHPLCQENVTMKRRDKDEEPILVTYIVANLKKWKEWLHERNLQDDAEDDDSIVGLLKRFRALRDDLRDYLKTKLAAHSVPTHFIPLQRMPLNPNGKIDKPALPFPDASEFSAAASRSQFDPKRLAMSETEKVVAEIWAKCIKGVETDNIGPNDSFFDLGGHSILAQYMIADVKKRWVDLDLDLVTIIRNPTLRAFAAEIDRSLDPIGLYLGADGETNGISQEQPYSTDASALEKELLDNYPSAKLSSSDPLTVFLTGATGFLGPYIIREILSQPKSRVIAHVRAKSEAAGLNRIESTLRNYGAWTDDWHPRLTCVTGDLKEPRLGMTPESWDKVAREADVVIHNGAQVHWVYPYGALKPANVLSTLAAMSLCATANKPKTFTYVSSTSVLDTDHYVQMSANSTCIPESNNLEGSRKGLGTGYGQSKWVSEYLVRAAGKRGLRGMIVRPGYVVGESGSGVTNTDDFLVRYLKGCIQLGSFPKIDNGINMVPVDHVARCVLACSLYPSSASSIEVAQITAHPRMTFTGFADTLNTYGYDILMCTYDQWRATLIRYVEEQQQQSSAAQNRHTGEGKEGKEEHALMGLYHFVTGDLPSTTIAPELDDANTVAALAADSASSSSSPKKDYPTVNVETIGRYLAFLVKVGFLPAPSQKGERSLPEVQLGADVGAMGRGRN
ncbi:MAG: hypothetical protein Q9218_003711 [Villophora microphyllina]